MGRFEIAGHHEKKKWRRERRTADDTKRIIPINMTHSEWICNTCGEGFETKGRRDGHRQRIHRRTMSVGMEDGGLERSESGRFVCQCGNNYLWPHSLRRHRRNCNTIKRRENRETTISDADNDAAMMDDDEGMGWMDRNELIGLEMEERMIDDNDIGVIETDEMERSIDMPL